MKPIKNLSNNFLFFCIIFLIFVKITLYISVNNNFLNINLGGGNDANYYDAYALGYENVAPNIWPVILKYLNDINIYSREFISYIFLFSNLVIIPIIVAKLSDIRIGENQKYYFYIILICLIYPTLFFFTFDIYRDIFMVLVFLIGCMTVKASLNSSSFLKFIVFFIISVFLGLLLLGLRPYLGYAFILSLFLWKIKFTKKRIYFLGALYFIVLFIANYIGLLESITEYRFAFEEIEAGSTLGLDFSNPALFIPNFILSFLGQMLGLYVTSPLALIILIIETLPFLFMLVYVFKNVRIADNFIRFLIVFFVIYSSVWLIGNDNLGTAIRLRLYNYLAVYVSFFYILMQKYLFIKRSKVSNQ